MGKLHCYLTISGLLCIIILPCLLLQPSQAVTDGAAIQLGDSFVFKNKQAGNLYLFHNRRAFEHCNFAQATLLHDRKETDCTWHPTRPGYYYFSTRTDQTLNSCNNGAKASLRVIAPAPTHYHGLAPLSAPPPTPGADLPSFPPHGWVRSSPSRSPESAPVSVSPSQPAIGAAAPPMASAAAPDAGEGIPFIGSNPAVPLPTGMTDTATMLPLPDRGDDDNKVVGLASFIQVQTTLIGFVVVFSIGFLSESYFFFV